MGKRRQTSSAEESALLGEEFSALTFLPEFCFNCSVTSYSDGLYVSMLGWCFAKANITFYFLLFQISQVLENGLSRKYCNKMFSARKCFWGSKLPSNACLTKWALCGGYYGMSRGELVVTQCRGERKKKKKLAVTSSSLSTDWNECQLL